MKPSELVDNTPTTERVAKMGERWQPAKVDQQVRRPYGRSRPALEIIIDKGQLTAEEVSALSQLRSYLNGASRMIGLVGSYGDQRWSGTTASQESQSIITEEWPIYCGQKVEQARIAINHQKAWQALLLVLEHDYLLTEVGEAMGYKTALSQKVNGWKWFHHGIPLLVAHYRWRSDAKQQHPGPDILT